MKKIAAFFYNSLNVCLCFTTSYFIFGTNISNITILGLAPHISILLLIIILSSIITILFDFKNTTTRKIKIMLKLITESAILSIFTSLIFDLVFLQMIADIQNIILSISISKLFIITFAVCFICYFSYSLLNYAAENKPKKETWNTANLFLVPIFYSFLFYTLSIYIDNSFPGLIAMIFQFSPLNSTITLILIGSATGLCLYFYNFKDRNTLLNKKHLILLIKIIFTSFVLTMIMMIVNTQALGIIQTSGFLSLFSQNSIKLLLEPLKANISSAVFISTATMLSTCDNDYDYTYFTAKPTQQN